MRPAKANDTRRLGKGLFCGVVAFAAAWFSTGRSGSAEEPRVVLLYPVQPATLSDGVPPGKARELVIAGVGHGFEDALAFHALDGNGDAPRLCGEDARAPRLNDDGRDVFRVDVLGKLR